MGFHNSFISTLVYGGIQGCFPFLLLFYIIYKYLCKSFNNLSSSKYVQFLIGLTFIQCLTHNSGPITGDPFFWIVIGLIIGNIEKEKYIFKKNSTFC